MHFGEIKQPEILIYPQWRTLDFKRGQRKNALASKDKLCRPETMPAGNQYARHDLSVWNKQQKSHLVSQNVFLQNIIYPGTSSILAWGESRVLPTDPLFYTMNSIAEKHVFQRWLSLACVSRVFAKLKRAGMEWKHGALGESQRKKTNKTHADARKVITDWIYFKLLFRV